MAAIFSHSPFSVQVLEDVNLTAAADTPIGGGLFAAWTKGVKKTGQRVVCVRDGQLSHARVAGTKNKSFTCHNK